MLKHTPPRNSTWDIFASAHPNDGLRSITLLANQLASVPTQRVRLFIDDPARLSTFSARIDATLWVQPLVNYELVRLRLADAVTPADRVVCLGNTEIPARYAERMIYGAGNRCKLFRLWPPGQHMDSSGTSTPLASSNTIQIDVVQDEKNPKIGLIKDTRNNAEMRARWKAQVNLIQTTLDNLGLPGDLAKDTLIVCCWGAAIANTQAFVNTLDQTSNQPVLLLLGPNPGLQPPPAPQGLVRCLSLPALSWSQFDEVVWSSDLLFCGQPDMALRAMESGTPLMWVPPSTTATPMDDSLLDWYFDELDPGFKRRLLATAHYLREHHFPTQELVWYLNQREELALIARQAAQRIAKSHYLADNLPHLSPATLEEAKRRKRAHENTHPATWPMSLLDPLGSI